MRFPIWCRWFFPGLPLGADAAKIARGTAVTDANGGFTVTFPASIELSDDAFVARGEIELNHDAFGLSPFTAMGGALSVRDLLVLKYEISGMRVADSK